MTLSDTYYELLGLTASATIQDIRKAYKRKALQWHPDINKDAGAHEKFILLREAYEYLLELKSGKMPGPSYAEPVWTEQKTQEARSRAETYAGMNYRNFKKSDYHKGGEALEVVADHLNLLFSAVLSVVILVALTTAMGIPGLFIGLFLAGIILYASYHGVEGGVNLSRLRKSLAIVVFNRVFAGILLFILNVWVLLMIGFQTLITLDVLFGLYFGFILGGLVLALLVKRYRTRFHLRFLPLCFFPLLVSAFLSVNYFLSSGPYKESYAFVKETYRTRKGTRESAFIILEHDAYDDFEGIRSFINYESLRYKTYITYTFETGFFGWRVMKDYKME